MWFAKKTTVATFHDSDSAITITYDSRADGNYLSEIDRIKAGLPILHRSTKRVGIANGGTSSGKYVTKLPFLQLSPKAVQVDSFDGSQHL